MLPRNITYQKKAFLLVLLLLALWWFTPVFFKRWTRVAFYEFQAPAWTAVSYLRDLQQYWGIRNHSKTELIESGIDMARLQSAYAIQNQRMQYLEGELRRLESYLDLPSYREYRYEVARVIRRDLSAWWQQMIIRKGAADGLKQGQAVVFRSGVVGRVSRVNAYTAVVELISSPTFRIAAHFEGDTRPVEYRGGLNPGLANPQGSVSNVPADIEAELTEPARLVTSQLGGTYPDGLTLGYVYNLNLAPDGIFQKGKVRLDPELTEIREVSVLIPITPETEEAEDGS